jgi:feruloyl-CoA synthase
VGPLRARIIAAGAPYVQDAVITGLNRHEVGAMIFPSPALRSLAGLSPEMPMAEVLAHASVREHFQLLLDSLSAQGTGSANRIARLCLLEQPPSLDLGEVTDKGSINQRAVLRHREAIVDALHAGSLPGIFLPRT